MLEPPTRSRMLLHESVADPMVAFKSQATNMSFIFVRIFVAVSCDISGPSHVAIACGVVTWDQSRGRFS